MSNSELIAIFIAFWFFISQAPSGGKYLKKVNKKQRKNESLIKKFTEDEAARIEAEDEARRKKEEYLYSWQEKRRKKEEKKARIKAEAAATRKKEEKEAYEELYGKYRTNICRKCDHDIFKVVKTSKNKRLIHCQCESCENKVSFKMKSSARISENEIILINQGYWKGHDVFKVHFKESQKHKRENIPGHVKEEVWRRDRGRCVNCGIREKLEYDHILPVSKGGSSTVRNVQMLCEKCNRSKGAKIGG